MDVKPTLSDLFFGFAKAGLQSFGGALSLVHDLAVEQKKWISKERYNEIHGLCQFVPGPNATNVSLCIGSELRGWKGSLAAGVGLLAGPAAFVCVLAALFDAYGQEPLVQAAAKGMGAAGAGILIAMALKQAKSLKDKAVWMPFALAIAVAVAGLKLPAFWVLSVGLMAGYYLAKARAVGGAQ